MRVLTTTTTGAFLSLKFRFIRAHQAGGLLLLTALSGRPGHRISHLAASVGRCPPDICQRCMPRWVKHKKNVLFGNDIAQLDTSQLRTESTRYSTGLSAGAGTTVLPFYAASSPTLQPVDTIAPTITSEVV